MSEKLYLVFVYEDVSPEILGPFETEELRDKKAKDIRGVEGPDHGIYRLDIADDGKPEIYSFSGAELDEEEEGG